MVACNSELVIESAKPETYLICSCVHYPVVAISASLALEATMKACGTIMQAISFTMTIRGSSLLTRSKHLVLTLAAPISFGRYKLSNLTSHRLV